MNIDLSRSMELSFRKTLHRADQLRSAGQGAEAAAVYREAARLSRQLAQYAVGAAEKTRRIERARDLDTLAEKVVQERPASTRPEAETPGGENDELAAQIDALITRADVSWNDIGGLEATKRSIQVAFGLAVAKRPEGVTLPGGANMLLFGPPGTGKSLLAAAVSNGLQATFFNVSAASLLSKWFGESSRLISTLYAAARRRAPSVVFLDELEALFPSRDCDTTGPERRVLAALLVALSGVSTSGSAPAVFTIGATNAPWLMDSAALSRFGRRVYVPLPDPPARRAILEIHLTGKGHRLEFPIQRLVEATEGLSGRQLAHLASAAVERMAAQCNPDLAEVVARGDASISQYELRTRAVAWSDVEPALAAVKPDASAEAIRRFEAW